jgi:hypothetical protein
VFTFCIREVRDFSEKIKLVSSANSINLKSIEVLRMSLIYSRNKIGPKMDPWGTPHVITLICECIPLKFTNCCLFDR